MPGPFERLRALHARDVMTSPPIYVMAETPVRHIASLMLEKGISAVPVMGENGEIIGMVSEGDLIRRRASRGGGQRSWWLDLFEADRAEGEEFLRYLKRHGLRAKDVMSGTPITVDEETPIARVAEILDTHRIKRVPVMRAGRMTGVLSRGDLLRALARAAQG
jgi:CBS domain-containing protein